MLTGWLRYAARVGTGDQGDIEDFIGEGDAWAAYFAQIVHGERSPDPAREEEWATWRDTAHAQFTVFRAHHDPGGELARWAAERGMDLWQAGRQVGGDPEADPLDLIARDSDEGDELPQAPVIDLRRPSGDEGTQG
jgi:hypothetical protein